MLILKGEDRQAQREVEVGGEQLYLALVADGHGGKQASVHCANAVFDLLLDGLEAGPPTGAALQKAGMAAFLAAHEQMLADKSTTAGSTLTVCIVNSTRNELTTLHAGDSVARLVTRMKGLALCDDHRIDSSEEERERLVGLGGKLARAMNQHGQPAGPLRLWPTNGPGVAQARAVGDRDVGAFIDPTPTARTVELPPSESCAVVLCSDGVWDAMFPNAVDAVVRSTIMLPPNIAARLVCNAALCQKHAFSAEGDEIPIDDTTVVVMRVEHPDDSLSAKGKACCQS